MNYGTVQMESSSVLSPHSRGAPRLMGIWDILLEKIEIHRWIGSGIKSR